MVKASFQEVDVEFHIDLFSLSVGWLRWRSGEDDSGRPGDEGNNLEKYWPMIWRGVE